MHRLKAAIYTRVSTEEQTKGYSLEAQESVLLQYAEKHGMEVYDNYCDEGFSGKDYSRPEVQRMFRDLQNDHFDIILIWKVDRLSRNNKDVLMLIDEELNPKNKKIIVVAGDIDSSTPTGYMFISLLSTFAHYERATIIERVNSGMNKRAEKGSWNGGKILGYDVVGGELVINEEEKQIVQEIFSLRAEGQGYKKIASFLNERGKKTKRENLFSIPGIKLILSNEVYIGRILWGKHRNWNIKRRSGKATPIVSEGTHEAIIDIKLWDKVQNINESQKNSFSTNRNFNGDLFLTGILKCPVCGAGTVMSKTKKRNGEGYHFYYMCQAYHSKGREACSPNLIRKEVVEERVLESIANVVNSPDLIDQILQKYENEKNADNYQLFNDIKVLEKELKNQQNKQSVLDEDYLSRQITPETYNRLISDVQQRINELEININNLKRGINKNTSVCINRETVIEAITNFNLIFANSNNEDKKMVIRSLIKEVHMELNRKEIKRIIFWFTEDNGLYLTNGLPSNKVGRTVP